MRPQTREKLCEGSDVFSVTRCCYDFVLNDTAGEAWNQPRGCRVTTITPKTPLGRIVALLTCLHGKLRMGTILKTCFSVGD